MNTENLDSANLSDLERAALLRPLFRNQRLVGWLAFWQVFMVFLPIAVPFFQSKGLTMQEVFTLQAIFSLLVLVAEVPSGYVADLLGRKQTLILGGLFVGIGHSLLLVADGFWTLALFEAALAVGHSLISGADIAMAYDTELAIGRQRQAASEASTIAGAKISDRAPQEQRQRQVVGKLFAVRNLSEAGAGVLCSVLLLYWNMDVAIALQAAVGWLPLLVAFALVEPPQQRTLGQNHWHNVQAILSHLWFSDRLLKWCFLALCIWPLSTFYAVWLTQELWLLQGIDLVHFGYLWAGLALISMVAGRYAHLVEDWLGSRLLLLICGLLPIVGYLTMASVGIVWGVVAVASFYVARGLGLVVLREGLNRRVPSEHRATANSVASFGFRAAFVVTGPVIGYAYDLWGMATTLWLLAAVSALLAISMLLPLVIAATASGAAAGDSPQP